MQKALPGIFNDVSVDGSKSVSLSFLGENNNEIKIENSSTLFKFTIPRDTTIPLPEFNLLLDSSSNNTNKTSSSATAINLLTLNGFFIKSNNVSIHYHIKPENKSLGYFAALQFGSNPYLSDSHQLFNLKNIFCPKGKDVSFMSIYSFAKFFQIQFSFVKSFQ